MKKFNYKEIFSAIFKRKIFNLIKKYFFKEALTTEEKSQEENIKNIKKEESPIEIHLKELEENYKSNKSY